ncbi:Uncharacterized protein OS=Plesiocystis pacifica SIR-1 GN=PPSIR1_40060 PE=4 SV=1 [Gemmataceae bacterium]|nr:Uncharacterized protein OS=Plesiocystis pacifica SIR-1 GN=PPSIR1_40060 PE=4 SV=1 [Gemmataceae bacterium]VTT98836.1 Uncharacterized protein OS=Plesiocystis pacifica SIR-1 GN=PPSIR1_40060 PE=4 SV=1 [Gemmataceae bacterium]
MQPDAPHHRYFRAKEGHWRGKIRFAVTDPRGLRASSVRWADKWSFRSTSLASRLSGLVLRTTVDYASGGDRNEVLHTTRVSNFGVPVYRSAETFFLGDDGRSFRIEGREAFFPFLRRTVWTGSGEVATDHDGASYLIPVFGLTMEQETRMTADGLEITQRTAFTRADILLIWQRPLKAASDVSGNHKPWSA